MIGMWTKFRKSQKNGQSHIYEFQNDYGFIGKFKLNESNLDFELLEYSDTYSERDLEKLKYYATKKIVETNFPESAMIAYG